MIASMQSVQSSLAPKKISKIQFGILQSYEIEKVSELQVTSRDVYHMQPYRMPATQGCIDPRLGISDKVSLCKTCNKKIADCAGHFGYIQLHLPVFHIGYLRHTLTILQCICKKCARVLVPDGNERSSLLKRLRRSGGTSTMNNEDALTRASLFKKVIEICKKNTICTSCGYSNGVIKKIGNSFKIVHEKYRAKQFHQESNYDEIMKIHPDLKPAIDKMVENMNPIKVYELLCRIGDEDMILLWMNSDYGRAESLIMWNIPVPPVPIRPSVPQDQGGSNEDDITIKLQEIIEMNNALKLALENGATMKMIAEDWEFLQIQVALLINGETPGIPRQLLGPRVLRGLCQRLKGKQGRFRGNLSGKRVDFSGRTVISPDPNLMVDQVGIPVYVAKIMTYPEKVNRYNIVKMRKRVLNGPDQHPGATIVRSGSSGVSISLQYGDRQQVAKKLAIGDVVDRHMDNDDYVLFNRQPSLHKMSIMCHRVRVFPYRTFRFNECACTPYNADFDGDEMNIHFPQTEEAKAEAAELMQITYNLITPRNGVPLVAATQDFLTGSYLLTQKDVFFHKADFCRLIAYFSDAANLIDLPPPTIYKPRLLWTGKQVISLLVRPNKLSTSFINLESEERFYSKVDKHFCANDGYVCFRQGELISGNLGKKTLGGDTKTGLFYVMIRDFGPEETIQCMTRLSKLTSRLLSDRGFSIGIDDVRPSPEILKLKQELLNGGLADAYAIIDQYTQGKIKLKPGCNALQSLESELNGILSKVREKCGDRAVETLHYRNSPLCMSLCGSKGSNLNISQMIACLGQQSVGGSRIQNGFLNRSLPHFPVGSLTPQAKGFVGNSFYSGLTATEFFFHTMGGREGLVDTAVKTAETGYMARRLMKALEDLSLQYDHTVRNSESVVIQFSYGDDGLNPQMMEKDDRPVEYSRILTNVQGNPLHRHQDEQPLTSNDIRELVDSELSEQRFTKLLPQGLQFIEETKKFFYTKSDEMKLVEDIQFVRESTPMADPPAAIASKECLNESVLELRQRIRRMPRDERQKWIDDSFIPSTQAYEDTRRLIRDNTMRITSSQIKRVLDIAISKYYKAMIEPGEAVGAVGAQSLSEPGTQMTLKTFHFAGVASMNVTLGVPRLKEIINASKVISTPIIEARLLQNNSLSTARMIKAKIEKTTLGEICESMSEIHTPTQSYIRIKLDLETIQNLHLNINGYNVKSAIMHNPMAASGVAGSGKVSSLRPMVLRCLKDSNIIVKGSRCNKILVFAPDIKESSSVKAVSAIPSHRRVLFVLQALKNTLPSIIVEGISTVSRAVINEEVSPNKKASSNEKKFHLLVEGYGLREVMACPGIDFKSTKTNHIVETQHVLGIEAARLTIALEIKYIMEAYGIAVDRRHLMLLSDVMTFKGEVLGITRFGVAKMKESVLMLASFEKTTDHLFDAAVHSREDSIIGVSECIIMGVPIPLGTGIFKLLKSYKSNSPDKEKEKEKNSNETSIIRSVSTNTFQINNNIPKFVKRKRLLECLKKE